MSNSDEYPKCKFCGRPIIWFHRRAYDARLPDGLSPAERFERLGKLWPHHCAEYHASKAEEP